MSSQEWNRFGWRSTNVPREPLADAQRAALGVPRTLRTLPSAAEVVQRPLFDPALKHFRNAYRAGAPEFLDTRLARRWWQAQRHAVARVLDSVAGSPWADNLVLRGSTLLRAWYGDAAREPGDLDFVVIPDSWRIEESRTQAMFEAIAQEAERRSAGTPVRLLSQGAVSDEIWTYDRVPGRRLLLPWESEDLPGGWVQLDFVFNEHLPVAPEPVAVPAPDDAPAAVVLGVTQELSLAWKLLWLVTDAHPQGKDLYDAVLLAENTALRSEVLGEVLVHSGDEYYLNRPLRPHHLAHLDTEWEHFRAEYPRQPETDAGHLQRLQTALDPTFSSVAGQRVTEYEANTAWLAPQIKRFRGLLARGGMDHVQQQMASNRVPPLSAIVITCELSGNGEAGLLAAHRLVMDHPAWRNHPFLCFDDGGELAEGLAALGIESTAEE